MKNLIITLVAIIVLLGCKSQKITEPETKSKAENNPNTETVDETVSTERKEYEESTVQTAIGPLTLAAPFATKSEVKISKIIGWKDGKMPTAPAGFKVSKFAENLQHPRWTYLAPNGDYFVAESNTRNSANQISLLRDKDGDGIAEESHVFREGLNQPFGMLVLDGHFYIANTDGLYRYKYEEGANKLESEGKKIVDLSASGYNNHWTRNIITNKEKNKIYISVGSASNVGEQGMEKEVRRANILEVNLDGTGEIIYGAGLRNPVGMDWNPVTGELWTAVNERDKLGNNLVPDYITSVKKGGWYGWPYSYYGQIVDPRWEDDPHMEMTKKAIIPDVPLGNHTASLGLVFYTDDQFPERYKNGAFVGQHGSWNRAEFSGYKIVFVPFKDGKPQQPEDFLIGFIENEENASVHGRPVGVAIASDGSLLVNDDDAGIIWRVAKM